MEKKPLLPAQYKTSDGQAPELQKVIYFGVFKEISSILLAFIVLVALILFLFYRDPAEDERSNRQKQREQIRLYEQTARKYVAHDHLTWPQHNNALATYLEALEHDPDAMEAKLGISAIGDHYREMIAELMSGQNLTLIVATIHSAERLSPHLNNEEYDQYLAQARADLRTLSMAIQQERTAAKALQPPLIPLQVFRDPLKNGVSGPPMVVIPEGTFIQGSPEQEYGRDKDEGPLPPVHVKEVALGQTEVTFTEYDTFAQATGRDLPNDGGWGRGNRPVINVSWHDAVAYTQWLTKQSGFYYRLPSETEWEYAARANTSTPFASGTCLTEANFDDRDATAYPQCSNGKAFHGKTVEVNSFPPNPWGLYQVNGNVREWLLDCWLQFNEVSLSGDGQAKFAGEGGRCGRDGKRVLRGGAWNADMKSARTANRYALVADDRGPSFGFRLAREIH